MSELPSFDNPNGSIVTEHLSLRRVRFVAQADASQDLFMEFAHPAACKAVIAVTKLAGPLPALAESEGIDIVTAAVPPTDSASLRDDLSKWVAGPQRSDAPPLGTILHGVQVFWRPGRAALLAAPDRVEPILKALVEFCYYEQELSKLEREVSAAWPELEADMPLTHEATPAALERSAEIGERMARTLQRRMRHARLQPHLARSSAQLSLQAQELGQRLREKSKLEERHETLDGQLATFERVYEMAAQRLSDYRASRSEHKLEWIIIVLLASEVLLLLAELLWRLETP